MFRREEPFSEEVEFTRFPKRVRVQESKLEDIQGLP